MTDLFRPHLIRRREYADGITDSNGDYILGGSRWSEPVPCRAEAGDGVQAIMLPGTDGEAYRYAYTVYLGADCPAFCYGDLLGLFEPGADEPFAEMPCKGFRRKTLVAKLWL